MMLSLCCHSKLLKNRHHLHKRRSSLRSSERGSSLLAPKKKQKSNLADYLFIKGQFIAFLSSKNKYFFGKINNFKKDI